MTTTVLVIDDSKFMRLTCVRILKGAGYIVLEAADGEQGLILAHDGHPDVILLDMLLPKQSGEMVLQRLKMDEATAQIPVIVLTSLSQKNEERLRKDGAAGFLEKEGLADNSQPLLLSVRQLLEGRPGFPRKK